MVYTSLQRISKQSMMLEIIVLRLSSNFSSDQINDGVESGSISGERFVPTAEREISLRLAELAKLRDLFIS